ncbi:MAG: helix-turn-helix transcriptional regulator [Anaerocolumna sp.]
MNYEHFGEFLQELRLSRNLTREQLAQDICTPKQIYRIEKGVYEPSLYLINQLSIKFNMDLNEYFKMYFTNITIAGLEGIKSINAAIESGNMPLLKTIIDKYEKLEDFKKGENLQHIYYGKALCYALLDSNYNTSLDYCFKGIQVEYPVFSIDNISKNMYSNVGISLLNCTAQNYFAMNQYYKGMKVLTELLTVLEIYVINSPYTLFQASQFSKKTYQVVLYNAGVHLFNHGKIKKALNYVEKGIAFSLKEYNLRHLPNLIFMKFKILYCKQKYEEAREYYNRAIYLYKITNKESILTELENTAKTDYPEIFKE